MSAHRDLVNAQQALNESVEQLLDERRSAVRDLAVEIGDYIDTPDFQLNPDANADTIDVVERILKRALQPLSDAWTAFDLERQRLDAPGGSAPRQTSIAAGHVNLHAKQSLRRNVVLSVVANHAQFGTGMTISELKGRLRKEHSSVSSAISELAKRGWLKDSGVKRKTQHGRDAIVWAPTEMAIAKCREVALEVADGT